MHTTLVIVESPTKAKTISKFLGSPYRVLSSYGHIRDLPKGKLGVDEEKEFAPSYVIPTKARKTVTALKKEAEKAERVILATDEDREGEAISWHLKEALGLKNPARIAFHEITEEAILEALEHPREIDGHLVDAQQARRVLDRLVGYKLSPFLWRKILRGLSAGRVQSAALRLVADREREIEAFIPQEYWSVEADLTTGEERELTAVLAARNGVPVGKMEISSREGADEILRELEGAAWQVSSVERKETARNPLPPFTTSTLQQTASRLLGFSAKQTMRLAQQLYETGAITYHRTDSLNLSSSALEQASSFISSSYGKEYARRRAYKTKAKGAQEAHEAIRPTSAAADPKKISDARLRALYDLIRKRFLASQMAPALFDASRIDIAAASCTFRATGQTLRFDGFLRVYPMKFEEIDLPVLREGEALSLHELRPLQHFTQPPARYTEATLVKELETRGIGRPSTYAPTVAIIQDRGYAEKSKDRRLVPTELGMKVSDLLSEHFPQIVDIGFTAGMEEKLDRIAEGSMAWAPMIREFYDPFKKLLEQKDREISHKNDAPAEEVGRPCPECSAPLVVRLGRFGRFVACSAFPSCRYKEAGEQNTGTGVPCPACGKGEIAAKRTKRGKIFYSCNRYPSCGFALWNKPTGETCSSCGSLMTEKGKGKQACSNKECKGSPS